MNTDTLVQAYTSAQHRILFFDYDGTLMELQPTPPEAAPTQELLQLMEKLTADPANTVVVISGRDRDTLDAWLGDLPVHFAAEHGFWLKQAGTIWQNTMLESDTWRQPVLDVMQQAVQACPGSTIEEKAAGIAWHYRTAEDAVSAGSAADRVANKLDTLELLPPVRVIQGNKVVEVQPAGINKGMAAQFWLKQQAYDFVLAAGDDTTDEDLLAAMPAGAHTIKVGDGPSNANIRILNPADMRQLLAAFVG
jgi:trehalose 6-phosphate synthase/phosphatase